MRDSVGIGQLVLRFHQFNERQKKRPNNADHHFWNHFVNEFFDSKANYVYVIRNYTGTAEFGIQNNSVYKNFHVGNGRKILLVYLLVFILLESSMQLMFLKILENILMFQEINLY
jgi:hypothetical protein